MRRLEMAATIEATVARVRDTLDVWARHIAARYNGPVYLCGSVLHNPAPRDIDIRVVIADHEFAARYGNECTREIDETHHYCKRKGLASSKAIDWDAQGPTQRWIDDVAKFTSHLSLKLGLNIDLQIWPDSYWREGTWPTPILLAAPSPKWWVYNAHCPDPAAEAAAKP